MLDYVVYLGDFKSLLEKGWFTLVILSTTLALIPFLKSAIEVEISYSLFTTRYLGLYPWFILELEELFFFAPEKDWLRFNYELEEFNLLCPPP